MDRILVVDDDQHVLDTMARILQREGHIVRTALDIRSAYTELVGGDVAIVLADINLAHGESGLDLAGGIRAEFPDVAVVMVSGMDDPRVADLALGQGAYGYLIKPVRRNDLLIAVHNAMLRRRLEAENRRYRDDLEQQVEVRTSELRSALTDLRAARVDLENAYLETVSRLAVAVEQRDSTTGAHLQRMSSYVGMLMRALGADHDHAHTVQVASQMHDIGKVGIPDDVLLSPGVFTAEQREIMRAHPIIGHRILANSDAPVLQMAATIALTHHERFDGSGYPHGLAGTEIPLEGRVAAIADVFDALLSARPYKAAWTLDRAAAHIVAERGRHFDPDVVDTFIGQLDQVVAIARSDGTALLNRIAIA